MVEAPGAEGNPYASDPVVDASAEDVPPPGAKLAGTAYERAQAPYVLQRLGPRTWWVEALFYHATIVVGDTGVTVIEPLSGRRAPAVLEAVREVTDKPVERLVYSHHHIDHLADAPVFVEAAAARGRSLEIVATEATATLIREFALDVPAPTVVLPVPKARIDAGGVQIDVVTPPRGHTTDNAIFIVQGEGVAHNVDMVHPGWIDLDGFGFAESLAGYEAALRRLLDLPDWIYLNAGHANIGSRDDVRRVIEYLGDLREAIWRGFLSIDFVGEVTPEGMPWDWFHEHRRKVVEAALDATKVKWSGVPGYSRVAARNAERVYVEFVFNWTGPGARSQPGANGT